MPYITFSRKFSNSSAKLLLKKISARYSVIELRGTKTVRKIAEKAASMGFKTALIINKVEEKKAIGREIKVSMLEGKASWRFGKETKLAVK